MKKKVMFNKNIKKKSKSRKIDRKTIKIRKYWHFRSFILSVLLSLLMVAGVWWLLNNPHLVKSRFIRFFLFSLTMMYPALVIFPILYPFRLILPMPLPESIYYMVSFFLYLLLIYTIIVSYVLQPEYRKKRHLIRIIIYILIFLALSIAQLARSFYT